MDGLQAYCHILGAYFLYLLTNHILQNSHNSKVGVGVGVGAGGDVMRGCAWCCCNGASLQLGLFCVAHLAITHSSFVGLSLHCLQ